MAPRDAGAAQRIQILRGNFDGPVGIADAGFRKAAIHGIAAEGIGVGVDDRIGFLGEYRDIGGDDKGPARIGLKRRRTRRWPG